MIIEYKSLPPFYKNGYVINFEENNNAVLIDPGEEVDELLKYINQNKLNILYILLTHAHIDHLFGLTKAKTVTNAKICLHPDDIKLYKSVQEQADWFGVKIESLPKIDIFLMDNQILSIGNYQIKTIHTPGHTPGGICFLINNFLFAGDTIFESSIGRTDLPGGDYNILINSIKNKLLILDDNTIIYPGHGPSTTIGYEKKHNPFLCDDF